MINVGALFRLIMSTYHSINALLFRIPCWKERLKACAVVRLHINLLESAGVMVTSHIFRWSSFWFFSRVTQLQTCALNNFWGIHSCTAKEASAVIGAKSSNLHARVTARSSAGITVWLLSNIAFGYQGSRYFPTFNNNSAFHNLYRPSPRYICHAVINS